MIHYSTLKQHPVYQDIAERVYFIALYFTLRCFIAFINVLTLQIYVVLNMYHLETVPNLELGIGGWPLS